MRIKSLANIIIMSCIFLSCLPIRAETLSGIKKRLQEDARHDKKESSSAQKIVTVHRYSEVETADQAMDFELAKLIFYGSAYAAYWIFIGGEDSVEKSENQLEPTEPIKVSYFTGQRAGRAALRSTVQLSLLQERTGIEGLGMAADFSPAPRWGLMINYQRLAERVADGQESLNIGRASVIFNRIRHGKLGFQWIIGATLLDDYLSPHLGGRIKYYLHHPISLQVQYIRAWQSQPFHDFEGYLGLHWQRFEIRAGYQYMRIGVAILAGPSAGLAIHF